MTDLTDRMRTCAAFIRTRVYDGADAYLIDAADLLIEASNVLDIPLPAGRQETIAETRAKLGEPVEIIPPIKQDDPPLTVYPEQALPAILNERLTGVWTDESLGTLPPGPKSRNACPKCDSRAAKTVHRQGNHFVLECSVCGHAWRR